MAPKLKVLVSLLNDQQDFQLMQAEGARAAAARAGLDVEVVFAESNPVLQIQQLFRQMSGPAASRPAAVVLEPAANTGYEAAARTAVQAKIGWVTLNDRPAYLEALQREFPDTIAGAVVVDNDEVGRIQARIFRTLLPKGGRLVYLEGPSLNAAAIQRRRAMEEGLAGSKVELVKSLTADWSAIGAERSMSFWLRLGAKSGRPDLIGSQNDEMALGASRALKAVKPEWASVLLTGCDGLPEGGQRLVREKVLAATVIAPAQAGPAVELLARALQGERLPPCTVLPCRSFPSLEELQRARA